MANPSWLDKQSGQDVQQAINTQSIQTALEKGSSELSDAAFQSYLTNAPIPRFYYEMDPTWAVNNGINQFLNWKESSRSYDPYHMMIGSGTIVNTFVAPIDGLYNITVAWVMQSTAATGYMNVYFYDPLVGLAPQHTCWLEGPTAGAGNAYQGMFAQQKFCKAGQRWAVNVGNVTGGTLTVTGIEGCYISGAWLAPYKQYKGGQ